MRSSRQHTQSLKQRLSVALANHHDSATVRGLARIANAVTRAVANDSADFSHNGEARVLEALRTERPVTLLDVGAHHGDWAIEAIERFPAARLHCFEIEPRNRERLGAVVGADPRVTVAPGGLGDHIGTIDVWFDAEHPDMTSSLAGGNTRERIACPITTGDSYRESTGIETVDFLKVDVEGADLGVLAGFDRSLGEGRVGIIQFEFTLWAAAARTWLGDFYDLLTPRGFTIGKIFPSTVEFRPYSVDQEIFVRANFLAVHESRLHLISRLR
jgi:FkbM family methyltransferase